MLDYLGGMLVNLPLGLLRLAIAIAFAYALWWTYNKITHFDDHEELYDKHNAAYLIQRLALLTGFVVAVTPSITNPWGAGTVGGLFGQILECLWVFVAMTGVRWVVDWVVLPKIPNLDQIIQGNLAVAVVEAGFYIGFGFILAGSLTGDAPSMLTGLAATVVFALLGLLVLIGVFWVHQLRVTKHMGNHLMERELTTAFEVGGMLVAMGIITRVGVAGDFTTWSEGFIAFSATVLIGIGLLYLARFGVDLVFLTNRSVKSVQESNQVVAAALLGGLFILVAVLVAGMVSTQL